MSNLAQIAKQREGMFEADPCVEHYFSDGIYAKRMVIPKGFEAGQHAHNYSHLSILVKGKVVVLTDDSQTEYEAPACIEIKAGVHHVIHALENSEWFCVHATEEIEVNKVDQVLIKRN
jgi:quercetin dioxygenase-like cupin family protein